MQILLFSDTHGYTLNMIRAINENKSVDMIIHLGDYINDALKIESMHKHIKHEYVPGNNDWTKGFIKEKSLLIEGKKILITHGHIYNVKKDYKEIISRGLEDNFDAVFFGHTHNREELFHDGMMILNPGTAGSIQYTNIATACLINIDGQKIKARFISF